MPASLVCPHCHSSLKTNKSMPAGLEVLCPKCKTFFKVPAGGAAPVAVVAGAASSSANGSIAAGRPSGVAPTHISAAKSRTSVRADDGRDSSETKPPDQKFKLAIAAGIVLLLAVAVCLVVWITSDRAGSPSDGSNADNKTKATNKGKDPDEGGDGNISLKADNQGEKKPPQETTLSKLTPEEKARVEGMKARALGWFKAMQDGSGSWPPLGRDFTGLAGLALLECKVPPTDPSVQKAAESIRRSFANKKETPIQEPYPICFSILFLNKLGDAKDDALIKSLAARLLLSQAPNGGWGYSCPTISPELEEEALAFLKDLGNKSWDEYQKDNPEKVAKMSARIKGLAFLQNIPVPTPPTFFLEQAGPAVTDNSHTQVALLTLWSIRKRVNVDNSLRLIVRRFQETQQENGSWLYKRGDPGEAGGVSMTCAGLLALAVGHALELEKFPEKKKEKVKDKQIEAGMKFVGNFMKNYDPQKHHYNMYCLWSMERVGVLFQQDKIDGQDWYRWGMTFLQNTQQPAGSWTLTQANTVDTSFALLFLQQANLAPELSEAIKLLELGGPIAAPIMKKD